MLSFSKFITFVRNAVTYRTGKKKKSRLRVNSDENIIRLKVRSDPARDCRISDGPSAEEEHSPQNLELRLDGFAPELPLSQASFSLQPHPKWPLRKVRRWRSREQWGAYFWPTGQALSAYWSGCLPSNTATIPPPFTGSLENLLK